MLEAQRSTEETNHRKSKTEGGIEEIIKEFLRDQPREEGAWDEHRHQHQPEDQFGFIIVPNPPKCEFFTTGGVKLNIPFFIFFVFQTFAGAKVLQKNDIHKKTGEKSRAGLPISKKSCNFAPDFAMEPICAISTAYGTGGIAVIRVSGEKSISIVDTLFVGRSPLSEAKGGTVHHGSIQKTVVSGQTEILDEVLCSVFHAPHSFTGEETVEIACHGSLYIQQTLLQWLIDAGARMAQPGEFTRRAFLNGKMDLSQAEAVADLIAAQSRAEKDLALSQLRGSVSNELAGLRDRLLHFTSLIELELDFADHEELEFADRTELTALATEIETKLAALMASFRTGNAIRNGIPVAIVGAPNVGKSTLLNALLGEQRAIVSDIQGTTRDTIEDTLVIDGILFRLIDTAGMRDTDDTLENMGIERSRKAIERAQIVVHVFDNDANDDALLNDEMVKGTIIEVLNKADLLKSEGVKELTNEGILISAKNGDIEPLKNELVRIARDSMQTSAVMLSNARHYEAVSRAHEAIVRVQQGLKDGLSGELLSMDLQDCLNALGEVTGQITNAEVLANIFSKFCIGK